MLLRLRIKGHPIRTMRIGYKSRRSLMGHASIVTTRVTQSRMLPREEYEPESWIIDI